ncbi:MAG TPA: VCBS repeat-containing protein, partial [Anaerolinea sp.]|nr:VCBS repeat-containing protein [Anaerolinea sp.]
AKLSSCPDISTSMAATLAEAPPSQPADVDTPQPPVSPADASSLWRMCYYENEGTITTPDFRLNASDNTNGQRYDPFIDPDGFLLELIGEYLVPSVVVADNSYQSFPDLVIGSKADGFQYLRNIGDESGPYFELGDPVEIGLGDLSISYAAPVFLDVDDDGISDLVVGSGDGTIRYFHNDQAPDNPFIGPFSEITGIDNPYSFLNAGQYAAPIYADVDSDGDQDLVLGSVLNTFAFYENITRPGAGVDQMAFVDYRFNPLGSVVPPGYADPYYRSVNFADLDQDGDLDAFVGSYSGAEYYLNLGTPQQAAFRLQPPERNPLRDVPPSNAATNVTFADTHPLQPGLEAYVGIRISGKGFLKGYQYNQVSQKYVLMSTQPFESFPPSNYSSNYEVSTRVAFIYNQDKGCMDAYVMMGYFKDRWYAVNQFLCDGLDGVGNPIYYPPMDATQFEENIGSAANPFYKLNWPLQSYFTDGQWNGSLVSQAAPDVWWFGNNLGEVQTLERSFYDKQNLATYIDRVTDIRDPFKGVKLVSPTIPTATDTNGDGLVDAYIASASGTIQYFTGSPVPPPSAEAGNPKVFLPLIQK